MEDLDSALNELGMLSSVTKYKIDYLQNIEASAEIKRSRSVSMPETRREDNKNVNISLNSNYVRNISLSPYVKGKLKDEIEEKRFNDPNSKSQIW